MASSRTRCLSVDEVGFFEGAEKLLEVWFLLSPEPRQSLGDSSKMGLRVIPRLELENLLSLVHCKILSHCCSESMDAYLLSESSLYVSANRFILKTCGTTSLFHAIKPLISLVSSYYPQAKVVDLFYSHLSFLKPHLQPHPHHSPNEETAYLDQIFPNGAAYILGKLNGDSWYLYTLDNLEHPHQVPDQTLEILMLDLDPHILSKFSSDVYSSARELTIAVGLRDLIPGAILDDKIFEPCGYSLNAIVKGDTYFTVHVTPQQECSFVSFETNLEQASYDHLIAMVMQLFRPGRCTLSLFASKMAKCGSSYEALQGPNITGHRCNDRQYCKFHFYDLTFAHYSRTTPTSSLGNGTTPSSVGNGTTPTFVGNGAMPTSSLRNGHALLTGE
jgi:S-adenosylmethionine decarboxylase